MIHNTQLDSPDADALREVTSLLKHTVFVIQSQKGAEARSARPAAAGLGIGAGGDFGPGSRTTGFGNVTYTPTPEVRKSQTAERTHVLL